MSMIRVTQEINRWLAENLLEKDIHVTIQFPSHAAAIHAEATIKREVDALAFGRIDPKGRCNEMTMNGISLTLNYRK